MNDKQKWVKLDMPDGLPTYLNPEKCKAPETSAQDVTWLINTDVMELYEYGNNKKTD